MAEASRGFMTDLGDALLGRACLGCGGTTERGRPVCPSCDASVPRTGSVHCLACMREEEPNLAPAPGEGLAGCPRHGSERLLLAGPPYTSPLNRILHAFKYAGAREAHAWLATLLPEPPGRGLPVWREYVLVPASLHAGRKAWRGFDQAFLLAKTAGDAWGIPVAEALERRREHPSQARLDSAARRKNVRGIFRMSKRYCDLLHGRPVLLIDDVATTGSTLLEAAAALEEASPSWILALVASHGGLPDGPEPPSRARVAG